MRVDANNGCTDDEDVNHEQLACIRDVWQQATDRASEAQELWGLATLQTFENGFAQIVRVRHPILLCSSLSS